MLYFHVIILDNRLYFLTVIEFLNQINLVWSRFMLHSGLDKARGI